MIVGEPVLSINREKGFGFIGGKLKKQEGFLLTSQKLERLLDAENEEEFIRNFFEIRWFRKNYEIHSIDDLEEKLYDDLKDNLDEFVHIIPDIRVLDIIRLKYDFHNIKILFKKRMREVEPGKLYFGLGSIPLEKLEIAFDTKNYSSLPREITKVILMVESSIRGDNIKKLEMLLDRERFRLTFELIDTIGNEYLKKLFILIVDLININTFGRCKATGLDREVFWEAFIPYGSIKREVFDNIYDAPFSVGSSTIGGKFYLPPIPPRTRREDVVIDGFSHLEHEGSFSVLERLSDDLIIYFARNFRWATVGIEPFINYFLAREMDIKNILIVGRGKESKLPDSTIKERLRDTYVQ